MTDTTTITEPRTFQTISEAERIISTLKLRYIGRRLHVVMHPHYKGLFAIAIMAGGLMGYVT